MPGFDVNTLTVMANESYDDFVSGLQKEIEDEDNIEFGVIAEHGFANIVIEGDADEPAFLGAEPQLRSGKIFWRGVISIRKVSWRID